jgi:hypothetical protein
MTPLQFAAQECSNYEHDKDNLGACKGIGIRNNGSLYSFGAKPKCVLATPGVRCAFFEECVIPMGIEDAHRHEARNQAVRVYRKATSAPKFAHQAGRICPRCKTRELEPRRQFCYVCSEAKQREANRNRQRESGST